jgi:hypothetical protein
MKTKRTLGNRPSEGQRLFARFRRESGKTILGIAGALGVSGPTVHDWLWARKSPSVAHRRAVELMTYGLVPAAAWETAEERAQRLELEGANDNTTAKAG